MMKRLSILLLVFVALTNLTLAKSKDVTLKPGETVYVRFDASGKKLKLVKAGTEPDQQAQVIFSLQKDEAKGKMVLRVENNLAKDLAYRAEMRSFKYNLKGPAPVTPVVAGKLAIENLSEIVEEITAFDFAYAKYQPAPETPKY